MIKCESSSRGLVYLRGGTLGLLCFWEQRVLLLSYIICETCRLLQFALKLCLFHLECYRELQRELFIINMQIFIPLKFIRVLAWIHLGVCPCGSLEINLNIPNYTNCLFIPLLLRPKS